MTHTPQSSGKVSSMAPLPVWHGTTYVLPPWKGQSFVITHLSSKVRGLHASIASVAGFLRLFGLLSCRNPDGPFLCVRLQSSETAFTSLHLLAQSLQHLRIECWLYIGYNWLSFL